MIIGTVLVLVILGVGLQLLTDLPVHPTIKILIQVVIVIAVVWILLGLIGLVPDTPFPSLRR